MSVSFFGNSAPLPAGVVAEKAEENSRRRKRMRRFGCGGGGEEKKCRLRRRGEILTTPNAHRQEQKAKFLSQGGKWLGNASRNS